MNSPRQTIVVDSQPQGTDLISSDWNNQVSSQPANREQIIADYQAEQARQAKEEQEKRDQRLKEVAERNEENRKIRNRNYDTGLHRFYRSLEPDYPGNHQGYHFDHSFKANDGNYYSEYHSNRGSNIRLYSLSERKWVDYGYSHKYCTNCTGEFDFVRSNFPNTCPHCQATYDSFWSDPKVQVQP